jgi:hypothetical protein
MQDVADEGHAQLREVLLVVAYREHVEQPLRGVRVTAVSRIDDVDIGGDVAGDQIRRAARGVAHDEHVRLHRRQVRNRIENAFPLGLRGGADRKIDDVGRQPLRRDLEVRARPGGWLEKQVEYRLAPQQRHFLHFPLGDAHERASGIENLPHHLRRQSLEAQQVVQFTVLVELRIGRIEPHVRPPGR